MSNIVGHLSGALSLSICREYLCMMIPPCDLGPATLCALRAETATKRLLFDRAMGIWRTFASAKLTFLDLLVKNIRIHRA